MDGQVVDRDFENGNTQMAEAKRMPNSLYPVSQPNQTFTIVLSYSKTVICDSFGS